MNLKPVATVTLLWSLASLLATVASSRDSPTAALGVEGSRKSLKHVELDDLNGSPVAFGRTSGDRLADESDGFVAESRFRRSPAVDANTQTTANRQTRQQPKKQRPGFLWTLASVTYETFNDTRSAIQQLGEIVNESLPPEPPRKKPTKKPVLGSAKSVAAASTNRTEPSGTTTAEPPNTTEPEFMLTRPLLQSLLRRNVKGLVRLFNIEWRDAMDQSRKSAAEFRRELGKQVGIYLQDNPNNY